MSTAIASPAAERAVLVATIVASSMAFIDGTALNVTLPALQTSLNADASQTFWVVNAYSLFLAALILVGGSLGDHLGRKRVFTAGIIVFTLASLACGASPSVEFLILARVVQGIGGALMVPGSLAILSAAFPSERRGVAIGTWSTFSTVTTILGPLVGGWLAGQGLWRAVFFINLPLAVIALIALRRVPESHDDTASARLDYVGAVLATLGLAGITFGFTQGPDLGFTDPLILGSIIGGVVALVAFVLVEARSPYPMVPLRLFRSRTFTGTNLLTLFLYGAIGAGMLFLSLNLIQVQGYDPALAGSATLPFAIMLTLLSRWAGGLASRIGPRIPLTVGAALAGVGFFLYAQIGMTNGPDDYWTTFLWPTLVLGAGFGLLVAPLTTAVMGSAPEESSGTASGINNAVARTASVLAIAVLGAVALTAFSAALSAHTTSIPLSDEARVQLRTEEAPRLGAAQPPAALDSDTAAQVEQAVDVSFVETYRLVLLICAALAWLSALLGWLLVENRLAPPEPVVAA